MYCRSISLRNTYDQAGLLDEKCALLEYSSHCNEIEILKTATDPLRAEPHWEWWQDFLKDSGGTGFRHETYFRRGGMEGIYDDVPQSIGFMAFAPVVPARGPMFGAAARGGKEFTNQPAVSEKELYDESAA